MSGRVLYHEMAMRDGARKVLARDAQGIMVSHHRQYSYARGSWRRADREHFRPAPPVRHCQEERDRH